VTGELAARAAVHAALAEPTRLRILDTLALGDVSATELGAVLGTPSNLLAHHLRVLERAGLLQRRRSEGDGRRSYLRLTPGSETHARGAAPPAPRRVLFVCTANTARSHLAAALWRGTSDVPAASAGTEPGERINPGALATAVRHGLHLPEVRPAHVDQVRGDDDLVVTVCDRAHEELPGESALHWSVPDPVRVGSAAAFDRAYDELAARVDALAPRLAS